jgi:hypothetical protein
MSTESLIVHARGPAPSASSIARQVVDVVATLPLFAVTPLLRPWHRRWGATSEEIGAAMPGDEQVPRCQYIINRALTIQAAPADVWPWLAQVGFGKAGFYSLDLLDNAGRTSAEVLLEDCQHPARGDWVAMFTRVNDTTAFRIGLLRPPHELLWIKPDSTWAWRLTARGATTRLHTRLRIRYRWDHPAEAAFSVFLNEFGDFPMMRRMLITLRGRAEAVVRRPTRAQQPMKATVALGARTLSATG